jgi:CDGSH-type Zn-finger protein
MTEGPPTEQLIQERHMADVSVKINDNGPYVISGDVTIVDVEGKKLSWTGSAVALCRCGESTNKPFCDGTHNKAGFSSEVRG